jgi:transposase-like protein
MTDHQDNGIPIAEAARHLNISQELIRKRIYRKRLSGYKVDGNWCYLYLAIDRDGNLVDVLLSERRDRRAAKRFLRRARETAGRRPERATTDGHDAYPRAIREELGSEVEHRVKWIGFWFRCSAPS